MLLWVLYETKPLMALLYVYSILIFRQNITALSLLFKLFLIVVVLHQTPRCTFKVISCNLKWCLLLCSVIISEGDWGKSFLRTAGSRMRFNLETRHVQGNYVSVWPSLLYFLRMAIRNIFILMKICIISLHSL